MDLIYAARKTIRRDYCPKCAIKKLLHKGQVSQTATKGYNNSTAMTPPMGWSSWNLFANHISEDLIKEIADAMEKSGLAECGYRYVNLDDCWEAPVRSSSGKLECDPITFPSGIKALADYVNAKGLKLGIYSSNGTRTCQDYPASLGYEAVDADTFAQWGIEYFKYDFCNNVPIPADAPRIFAMNVGVAFKGDLCTFRATDARLTGNARVLHEEKGRQRAYISGLCSRNGKASFDNVEVPESGVYVLTFITKTGRQKPEFAYITVNGVRDYTLSFPPTKRWMDERRDQVSVQLEKGINTITVYNPIGSTMDSAAIQYKNMGLELKRATREYAEKNGTAEKPIVYSICEWGRNKPWKWGYEAGNLWRTTPDIMAKWTSIVALYEFTVRLWKYSVPGGWNDPDMLEVGNGNLTHEENRSHFSLWCMLCAPLILGNDVRSFIKPDGTVDTENRVYKILTDMDMIAVNQDTLGIQCRRFKHSINYDILVKPLENNEAAVCFFNKGKNETSISVELSDIANEGYLNLPKCDSYNIFDIWEKTTASNVTKLASSVPSHGVKVYRVSAK